MVVSVGFVVEEGLNIVPLKIGGIEDNADIFDLAVIYTKSEVRSCFCYFCLRNSREFR
jgi:hypothetical protein